MSKYDLNSSKWRISCVQGQTTYVISNGIMYVSCCSKLNIADRSRTIMNHILPPHISKLPAANMMETKHKLSMFLTLFVYIWIVITVLSLKRALSNFLSSFIYFYWDTEFTASTWIKVLKYLIVEKFYSWLLYFKPIC